MGFSGLTLVIAGRVAARGRWEMVLLGQRRTTALVCERFGLDSIGIDTSAEYIALAEARIAEDEQKRIDEQIKQLRKEAKGVK